jgi:hypothetical protein
VAAFWVWHLFLLPVKGVFAKPLIELHKLQSLGRVSLVFRRRVIILAVFGTHDSNDFSGFGFLGHLKMLRCAGGYHNAALLL